MILIINDGKIAEQGTLHQLLIKNEEFSRFWKEQFSTEVDLANGEDVTSADQVDVQSEHSYAREGKGNRELSESSFRADAPVFIPHYQRGTEASTGQPTHIHLGAGHQHSHDETAKYVHSHNAADCKSDGGSSKRLDRQQKPTGEIAHSHNTPTSQSIRDTSGGKHQDGSWYGKQASRPNRWQRRQQAKSEGFAQGVEQVDGATDTGPVGGSHTGKKRHVSGPGNYPTGPSTISDNGGEDFHDKGHLGQQQQRRRRQRHLRIKEQRDRSATQTAPITGGLSSR